MPRPQVLRATLSRGILSRLPEARVDQLTVGAQRIGYPAGSTIPTTDDRPWVAVVLAGCFRLYLASPDGGQITLRYLQAGDIVGTFQGEPPSLARNLLALERSEMLHLDAARMSTLAQKEPDVAWELVQEVGHILDLTHRSYGIRTFGSVRLRVANAILDRAIACGSARNGTVVPGTQQELATAAGTVREVVAPALHALRDQGVIAIRRGAVEILDADALIREADGSLGLTSAVLSA